MLKFLIKKQFLEVFRGYFFDAKKNKMRSKGQVTLWIIFFVVMMVVVLGGLITTLAISLNRGLNAANAGWLYYVIMSCLAIILGAFGSVFSTYSGLYLAKDNDLLLSLPIPVRTIMTSRLITVFLMGVMYAGVVMIPTLIVDWIVAKAGIGRIAGGILLFVIITAIVMLLSVTLGWVVAKLSLKLKNKSIITTLIALAVVGIYYYVYFQAVDLIQDLIKNAVMYGNRVKGAAYGVYLFGRIGEGDFLSAAIFLAIIALLSFLVWRLLSRSFIKIATSSAAAPKVRYQEKIVRAKSPMQALAQKELRRFISSSNYMLNCGFSILLIPASGILLLIKGKEICEVLNSVLGAIPNLTAMILLTALFMMSSMIDTATPAVSLEGKSLWIPQSLPVHPKTILRSKALAQLILSFPLMLFTAVSIAVIVPGSLAVKIMLVIVTGAFSIFLALFDTVIGTRLPVLGWTSEVVPIKQTAAIMIVLLGGWLISILPVGLYLFFGRIGAVPYLLIWTVLFGGASAGLLRWLDTRGARIFSAL
ncbi:MAG: hypothetical protein IIY45_06980 [Firmicutes bacterium]|nr:hypothetical protein [Bacillota bacterium]